MNAPAVKAELIRLLAALPDLAGVQVVYSFPGNIADECVYGGDMSGPVAAVAFRGGGRTQRDEQALIKLHVRVNHDGFSIADTETRAAEIGTAVENYVAANPTLADFPGLKLIALGDYEMSSAADDDGSTTVLTYQVAARSILT